MPRRLAPIATLPSPRTAAAPAGVSVVVPVYNGAGTLRELVARLVTVLSARGAPFEVLLVNDGSADESRLSIEQLAAADSRIRGLDLMRNFGQHAALLAGIRAARHAVTITLDDDLQHPPEEIPRLLAELDHGADVVYGAPFQAQQSRTRRLVSWLHHRLLSLLADWPTARYSSSFRAFRTELRRAFDHYGGSVVTLDVLLGWGASRFSHVLVEHAPRRSGASNYGPWRLLLHALQTLTSFSVRPLRAASLLGLVCTAVGLAATAYALLFFRLRGLDVPADTFIFAVVCSFSGIQLFALGIIGEYLARVHVRTLERPPYAVRRAAGFTEEEGTLESPAAGPERPAPPRS